MKTKMTVTLSLLLAGLLVAVTAAAQKRTNQNAAQDRKSYQGERQKNGPGRRGPDGRPGPGFRGSRMMDRLDLTEKQRAEADKIREESRKAAEPMLDEIEELRRKMHAAWQEETPDKETVLSLHRKIHTLRGKLAEQRIADKFKLTALLTPKQRELMKELGPARYGRGYGKGHGRGHGRGRGHGYGYGPGPNPEPCFGPGPGF
jgi:Spy/CpxP family protein refolding chaperone